MKVTLIKASCDLGTHVDGARFGPDQLLEKLNLPFEIEGVDCPEVQKSHNPMDLHKNEQAINEFNQELYTKVSKVIQKKHFPITIGGDHSIAIASALASGKTHSKMGILWFDSHADYNTFETTITGNIHGLPLATINGLNRELSKFHHGPYYDPKHTVIVGYRAQEANQQEELQNVQKMGVTVFTTETIKQLGMKKVMEQALEIVGTNTDGIHISYDLDALDPTVAPGVSIPEPNGLTLEEGIQFIDALTPYQEQITSFDLVELNPLFDHEDQTILVAEKILKRFLKNKEISDH